MKVIEYAHIFRLLILSFLLLGVTSMGGCKTLESLSETQNSNLNKTAKNSSQYADNKKEMDTPQESLNLADRNVLDQCPKVSLVNVLSELHQFRSNATYSENEKIAHIHLNDIDKHCVIRQGELAVNLTLTFDAFLGPKSKIFDKDRPTVSYPYFIAVTDSTGKILDKEIHGISLSFDSEQSKQTHIERIQKSLDLGPRPEGGPVRPPLSVMVGFQLSPEELKYNQINRGKLLGPEAGRKPSLHQKTLYTEGLSKSNSPI